MRKLINSKYRHLSGQLDIFVNRDYFELNGETLYNVGRNLVKRFQWEGMDIVVKRFGRITSFNRLMYSTVRESKAMRAYKNASKLRAMGISTPEEIAVIETFSHGMLLESYFISAYTPYSSLSYLREFTFEKKEWFNAHYYAELGIKLCTSKDPNYEELRMLSSQAWNNITKEKNLNKTEAQQIFQKKYEGYLALVQDDDLRAYYLFRNLYKSSVEMQKDADVIFYLDVAANRLLEKYFFIDETFELKSFETSNDVCFSYDYIDGSQDIVYFKGLTTVKETGDAIQYLRDLYVISFTKENKLYRTMYVPYAKVKPVSVEYIDYSSKNMLGIDNSMTYVPYIMLKSIGRDFAEQQSSPLYTYSDGTTSDMPEFMILPLEFEKFTLLEMTNEEPKNLPIMKLYKLVSVVDDYGYSQSVYAQTLLNRLLYPLFMLIVFVALASFAWNNKIGSKQYFKFSWVAGFPFFILASGFLYNVVMYLFKIMNYVMVSFAGGITSLIIAIVVYVVMLIVVSLYFLARKDNED